jgi:hypothetical protein
VAERAVAVDDGHVARSGRGEAGAGASDDVGIEVDGGDLASVADQVREQAGVVAGASADLQDPLPRFDLQLFQHHRDDRRLRCGAGRHAGAVVFGVDGFVGVGVLDRHAGHEQVAGHGPWGFLHETAAQGFLTGQLVDQRAAQALFGSRGFSGRLGVHRADVSAAEAAAAGTGAAGLPEPARPLAAGCQTGPRGAVRRSLLMVCPAPGRPGGGGASALLVPGRAW